MATNGSSTAMKVGDKVSREPVIAGNDTVFYRVKSVNQENNSFETDPNGPFDRGWKGRITDHKPHHTHLGYWVPLTAGTKIRASVQQMKDKQTGRSSTSEFNVTLNWYGEVLTTKVRARSEAQALVVASMGLARTKLKEFSSTLIHQYMKNNQNRVTIKPLVSES